jgi:hypothetical protein
VALACENGLRSSTDTSQATARPAPKVRQVINESYEMNEAVKMLDAVRAVTAGLEKRLDKHEPTTNRKLKTLLRIASHCHKSMEKLQTKESSATGNLGM